MNSSVPNGWKSVKLDDVAEETSDRVDNPSKSGYDRFVGLEHLDSGELTVRRWGSTANLLSAMKLFKSGDILIGRRNAYLKRASKAEFDGVCSGDAYVVREKPGTIAEGLLPVVLNSDSFWDYAIAHASGTMSKRAKWRDLAEYSFLLPSPAEQRRIATTLWAAEDCIVKGERFVAAAERAKQVLMRELFSKGTLNKLSEWKSFKVRDIASPSKNSLSGGPFGSNLVCNDYVAEGVPVIRGQNMGSGKYIEGEFVFVTEEKADRLTPNNTKSGDLIFTQRGTLGQIALVPNGKYPRYVISQSQMKLRPNPDIADSDFLYYLFTTPEQQAYIKNNSTQTGVPHTNLEILKNTPIPIPPLPEQHQIATILTHCDETIAAALANVGAAKALKMKMINEMLSPKTG